MGGRLALVKSTLSNLPIYYMSLFKIPVAVANKIERIQRQFLWGDSEGKKKLHLVKWDKITKNKKFGGLGIKRLMEHNAALLAKWWWRFSREKEALWVRVISKKYSIEENAWLPHIPSRSKPSKIWKDICSVGEVYAVMGECIVQGFNLKVNSGSKVKFWKDKWLGNETLKATFPRLYNVSTQKNDWVADMVDVHSQGYWNLQFRRPLFEWEKTILDALLQLLEPVQILNSSEDCLQWKWSKDLTFTVKSAYQKWEDQNFEVVKELLAVWKNICPPKVELFSWMAIQNCIASKAVLASKGIINNSQTLCPFCNSEGETPSHLLLHCYFSWSIWSAILSWWNLTWVCPASLVHLLNFWNSFGYKNLENLCWIACFYAVIWTIWTCRNDAVFNNKTWEIEEIADLSKTRMAIWIKGKFIVKDYSVDDFKRCLDGIRRCKI